jgi:hypothetical protein
MDDRELKRKPPVAANHSGLRFYNRPEHLHRVQDQNDGGDHVQQKIKLVCHQLARC